MEIRMFQNSWHGIDLTTLPAAAAAQDKPASAEFYAQFYHALASGRGHIDPQLLENKRRLGDAIERDLIAPWKKNHGRAPSILALGAGKAPAERVWHERGHAVTFHDCQEDSLADVRRCCPGANFLIGDLHQLASDNRYDFVAMIGLDYVMNRREFTEFLSQAARWLDADGQIIVYCASTLSFRQAAVEIAKHCLGVYRRQPHVFWGYWRTPGEFSKVARRAKLHLGGIYSVTGGTAGGLCLQKSGWPGTVPSWRNPHLVATFETKR
jgi:hypothetical protein